MAGTPTHAIIVRVTFKEAALGHATEMLQNEVIPAVKQAQGFCGGYWLHDADHLHGTSVELFDSLANAEADLAKRSTTSPPDAPVTIDNVEILEIVGSA